MYKRLPTIGLCLFFFTAFLIMYFSYQIYCKITINEKKSNIITAQKAWNNYFYLTNKINLTELKNFSTEQTLVTSLNKLNEMNQGKKEETLEQTKAIEDFAYSKASSNVDIIAVYNNQGSQITALAKTLDTLPEINLQNTLNQVLNGKELSLNLSFKGNLYYSNIAPVKFNDKIIGAILVGKKINNSLSAYIQDISSSDLIVFSKERLLAASLPYITDEDIYLKNNTINPLIINLLNTSDPTQRNKIQYIQLKSGDFWAAGKYITGKTGGYLLLTASTKWLQPYLFIQKHLKLFFFCLILISTCIGILSHKIITTLLAILILKTAEIREIISNKTENLSKKLENIIDTVLSKAYNLFNIEFFNSNKDFQELSSNLKKMIHEYKEKSATENFVEEKKINYMTTPDYKTGCSVTTRKTTLYYSNIKNFNELIDYYSPSKAITTLSIYLQLQQEIIHKHNGRVIYQTDDRLIATFETEKQAENAIRAAFDVQNTILKLSAVNPESIELSVSIASGDATIAYMSDRENYFGPATKVVKALCSITLPGHIFIDRLTYELADIHSLAAPKEIISVKGFKNPVQYYRFNQDQIINISTELAQEELSQQLQLQ